MSCDMPAVVADHISKTFWLYPNNRKRFLGCFISPAMLRGVTPFHALTDLNFELYPGEALALIGKNGAGKSTALQILTGVLTPSSGQLKTRGRICALLELGSGFNVEFTGKENVYLNGALLGLSKRQLDEKFDEIAAFADIGEFLYQPVKTYSSGMYVRLAFAVQACLEPDILIVDEALAVGDIFFQQKCHAHIEKLMAQGTAIILVTHDMSAVLKYCNTAILLEKGKMRYHGDVQIATRIYHNALNDNKIKSDTHQTPSQDNTSPTKCMETDIPDWPDQSCFINFSKKEMIITEESSIILHHVAISDSEGKFKASFHQGEFINLYWCYETLRDFNVITSGLTIYTHNNIALYAKNFIQSGCITPEYTPSGTKIFCHQRLRLNIAVGSYTFSLGFSEYPKDTQKKLLSYSPSEFIGLGKPLLTVNQVSTFDVVFPSTGISIPFHGLTDLCDAANINIRMK